MSFSVNKVWLGGNAGADAVSVPMGNGNTVVKVSLATERWWMEDGVRKEVTDWHNVSFFGKVAERAIKIKKGMVFSVIGRNQTFVIEKDGEKRYRTEVVVDMKGELEILGYVSHTKPERAPRAPSSPQQQPRPQAEPGRSEIPLPIDLASDPLDGEYGGSQRIPF